MRGQWPPSQPGQSRPIAGEWVDDDDDDDDDDDYHDYDHHIITMIIISGLSIPQGAEDEPP
jgi:hypothetical protein